MDIYISINVDGWMGWKFIKSNLYLVNVFLIFSNVKYFQNVIEKFCRKNVKFRYKKKINVLQNLTITVNHNCYPLSLTFGQTFYKIIY